MRAKREGEREKALKLTRECTAGFVGICDLPGLAVIEEMLEIYPDVKVVLVTRDPVQWYISIEHVLKSVINPFFRGLMCIAPTLRWFPAISTEVMTFFDMELQRAGIGKKKGEWGPCTYCISLRD